MAGLSLGFELDSRTNPTALSGFRILSVIRPYSRAGNKFEIQRSRLSIRESKMINFD